MLPSDDDADDADSASFPLKGRNRATFPNDQWISILPVGLGALVLYETTMRSGLGPWSITNLPLVGVLAFAVLLFGGMAADPFVPHRVQQIGVDSSGISLRFHKRASDYLSKGNRWGPKDLPWYGCEVSIRARSAPTSGGGADLRTLRGTLGGYRVSLTLDSAVADTIRSAAEKSKGARVVAGTELGSFEIHER